VPIAVAARDERSRGESSSAVLAHSSIGARTVLTAQAAFRPLDTGARRSTTGWNCALSTIAPAAGGGDHRGQIREARSTWINASSCSSVALSTGTSNIKEVGALRMDSASRERPPPRLGGRMGQSARRSAWIAQPQPPSDPFSASHH